MFDNIIADLQGWQKQLDERAATLKKDQEAFNKQLTLIESTIKAHTAGVVVATVAAPKKRGYTKSGLPSSAKIRGMVHRVLASKKRVSQRELIDRVHALANLPAPKNVSESKMTGRIYTAVKTLKARKLIKGSRKGFSLTALGRPGNKHWT